MAVVLEQASCCWLGARHAHCCTEINCLYRPRRHGAFSARRPWYAVQWRLSCSVAVHSVRMLQTLTTDLSRSII
jgi:hypothetical protein